MGVLTRTVCGHGRRRGETVPHHRGGVNARRTASLVDKPLMGPRELLTLFDDVMRQPVLPIVIKYGPHPRIPCASPGNAEIPRRALRPALAGGFP